MDKNNGIKLALTEYSEYSYQRVIKDIEKQLDLDIMSNDKHIWLEIIKFLNQYEIIDFTDQYIQKLKKTFQEKYILFIKEIFSPQNWKNTIFEYVIIRNGTITNNSNAYNCLSDNLLNIEEEIIKLIIPSIKKNSCLNKEEINLLTTFLKFIRYEILQSLPEDIKPILKEYDQLIELIYDSLTHNYTQEIGILLLEIQKLLFGLKDTLENLRN